MRCWCKSEGVIVCINIDIVGASDSRRCARSSNCTAPDERLHQIQTASRLWENWHWHWLGSLAPLAHSSRRLGAPNGSPWVLARGAFGSSGDAHFSVGSGCFDLDLSSGMGLGLGSPCAIRQFSDCD